MRQIYTSPRQENVKRVVALLGEAGIETSIQNRNSWQGGAWKRFSYSERKDGEAWPQVWVTHANDQARAREVLREAGLEPATRFADELAAARTLDTVRRHRASSTRLRMVLLGLIAGVVVLIGISYLSS
ncbi:putative signal transducing protein [Dokdonella sp. MW10]|uniref:putative signal transducing protein n=1 Tax=Dokdonella sp. MW10 TaxID=2992926 RepID=UPI003F81107D